MATRRLAYALGSGGARGALQVGAIRALLESGLCPDVMVGTSAGAINATYLAIRGLNRETLEGLERTWQTVPAARLVPMNRWGLATRMMIQSTGSRDNHRLRGYFLRQGLGPDLRFRDLMGGIRLIQVAANLTARRMICYGTDPDQSVLEGLLASTAIPPWGRPIQAGPGILADGWAVSSLPVQPALAQGATAIIALDLNPPIPDSPVLSSRWRFWAQWLRTVAERQTELELALAEAHGVPVWRLRLHNDVRPPVAAWDFKRTDELIAEGYRVAREALAGWPDLLLNFGSQAPGRWLG